MNPAARCKPYEGCKGTGTQHDLSNGVGECYCDCLTGQALRHADRAQPPGTTMDGDARHAWMTAWARGDDPHAFLEALLLTQPDHYAIAMRNDAKARRAEQKRTARSPLRYLPRDWAGCADAECPSRAACLRAHFAPDDGEGQVMSDHERASDADRCNDFHPVPT